VKFEYKVKCRHKLGWKEIKLYADTDIEEFFNRNGIEYVRNITDTIEHRQLKEIERLNNIINELEKWLEEQLMYFYENNAQGGFSTNVEDLEIVKDKLQELKGNNLAIPPEVIGTNGVDGGLFDYGDR